MSNLIEFPIQFYGNSGDVCINKNNLDDIILISVVGEDDDFIIKAILKNHHESRYLYQGNDKELAYKIFNEIKEAMRDKE